jgi:murein DD-endopeptidase MepM/ murein hydrolase activator NlpD
MALPTKTGTVTCPWDKKGKAWKSGRHGGIDYKAATGTEIYAIADGKIVYQGRGAGWGASYGLHVIVQHGDHRVIYAHLSKLHAANLRDRLVKEGEIIGLSGATGNCFGPHLHLEARKAPYRYDVDAVDPGPLVTPKTESGPTEKESKPPKE